MAIKRIFLELYYNNHGYIWFLVALAFLLAELTTPGLFFFLAFAIGCIIGAVFAFLEYSFVIQCIISLITTGLAFWILRKKFAVLSKNDIIKTNFDALVGAHAVVIADVTVSYGGQVKVRGEIWPARTEENNILKGDVVKVIRVEGNSLIVIKK